MLNAVFGNFFHKMYRLGPHVSTGFCGLHHLSLVEDMELWQLAILAIGGNAALLAVLGWLAKSFLTHLLEKDVKRYELTLKAQTRITLSR